MRRTKEEAEITRQRLLKAALTVFSRQGYADTRLEDIAEEAEVTRGAIYHHFGSKAELYNTLMADNAARINPVMEKAISEADSPLAILRNLLTALLVYATKDETFRAVSELVMFKTAVVPELEAGMQMKRQGTQTLIDYIAQVVQQGIDAGQIRAELDPRDVAIALFSFQSGVLMSWLLDPKLFSLKQRAEPLADIFIQGIATG